MKPQLSDKPIWMKPTLKIRALDSKSVVVVNADGSRTPAKLKVVDADPQSAEAAMCYVKVWQAMVGNNIKWTDVGTGMPPPAEQIQQWQAFLNESAAESLRENDDEPQFGELLLILS